MMTRRLTLILLACLTLSPLSAQPLMKEVFRAMPDAVLPYLSQNNRLDFIDFVESGMKAEVKNLLDGTSEMTSLAEDSLTIRMNESVMVTMLLLPLEQTIDSLTHVVALVTTYSFRDSQQESRVDFYTPDWRPLTVAPRLTMVAQRRIEALKMQTLFKWEDKNLNKS